MTTWFTSDTHFAHVNIVEFCQRPFRDVEEMNRVMIERWNARVQPGDTVYHLGDFAFGPADNIDRFRNLLAGKIVLILGNHDRSLNRMLTFGFESVAHEARFTLAGVPLRLTHKPTPPDPKHPVPSPFDFHLHGHVHEKYARRGNQINVGVDVRGFAPATLEELLATPSSI